MGLGVRAGGKSKKGYGSSNANLSVQANQPDPRGSVSRPDNDVVNGNGNASKSTEPYVADQTCSGANTSLTHATWNHVLQHDRPDLFGPKDCWDANGKTLKPGARVVRMRDWQLVALELVDAVDEERLPWLVAHRLAAFAGTVVSVNGPKCFVRWDADPVGSFPNVGRLVSIETPAEVA